MKFCIVKFLETSEFEIVLDSWMEKIDGCYHSWWPRMQTSAEKLLKLYRKNAVQNPTEWNYYKVELCATKDSLLIAQAKLKNILDSNTNCERAFATTDEDSLQQSRSSRKRKVITDMGSELLTHRQKNFREESDDSEGVVETVSNMNEAALGEMPVMVSRVQPANSIELDIISLEDFLETHSHLLPTTPFFYNGMHNLAKVDKQKSESSTKLMQQEVKGIRAEVTSIKKPTLEFAIAKPDFMNVWPVLDEKIFNTQEAWFLRYIWAGSSFSRHRKETFQPGTNGKEYSE